MATAAEEDGGGIDVVDTLGVLASESERIWPHEPRPRSLDEYYAIAQRNGQAALCLSGGGIRSASFALGVLQALSAKGLLTGFHYLSTVSGGGYMGAWLQRWIHEPNWDAPKVMKALAAGGRDRGAETAEGQIPSESRPSEDEIEARQIKALRENSNFITPRVGLRSNDTWTAISISVRNIGVNWLLFAPLFVLVAIVPNLFSDWIRWVGVGWSHSAFYVYVPLALALLCAVVAAWHTVRALPSYRPVNFAVEGAGDGWLLSRVVKWLIGWAIFGTMVLWPQLQTVPEKVATAGAGKRAPIAALIPSEDWAQWPISSVGFALISLLVGLTAVALAGNRLSSKKESDYRDAFRKDFLVWVVAFGVAALTIPVGSALFNSLPIENEWRLQLFATVGPIWLMGSQLMIAFVFAAFRRDRAGTVDADGDREWLARLSAVKIKQMLVWGVLAFCVLLLFQVIRVNLSATSLSLTSLVGMASGAIAVFGGRGTSSGHTTSSSGSITSILRYLPLKTVVALATFVFVVALLTLFGAIEQGMAAKVGTLIDPWIAGSAERLSPQLGLHLGPKWLDKEVLAHVLIGIVLLLILLRLDKRIPVNRFSLNGLYRNRLGRAYLGGARDKRDPDRFTGFDPADNVHLHDLRPEADGKTVLYPVVNVALNVTASEKLAWQERKAEPFILSPLFCGSGMLEPEPDLAKREPFASGIRAGEEPTGVYVRSYCYGGSEPEMIQKDKGISLATAISISGAAASPNMGYHSSPATAFLMTLFNVRLGQWMPNPARAASLGEKVYLANPSSSLRALMRELGGSTDDLGSDVYLSDGGHFENLALYEMVRRRCRFIVVSDAGADPNCDFEDLGNAIRKVKIDLGATIRFRQMRISGRNRPIEPQMAWAVGDIFYGDGQTGRILYIKPSFFGHSLPIDVVSYAAASATFPHETTGDQFFSESQFESYRKLGYTLAQGIGEDRNYDTIEELFLSLDAGEAAQDEHDRKLRARFVGWLRGLAD